MVEEAGKGGGKEIEKAANTLIGNAPYGCRLVGLVGKVQFVGARAGFIINRDDIMRNKKVVPGWFCLCLFQIKW